MYLALGVIFLIAALLMGAIIIYTCVRAVKSGGELITKKNLFYLVPAFLIIYLLHITAAVFNGDKIDFFYCFSLIGTVLDVLRFKADGMVAEICKAHHIFYADFALAFILGSVTVILSVASFFSRRISNFIKVKTLLRKNCDIIAGDSPDAVKYIINNKNSLLLAVSVTNQRYVDLMKQNIPVLRAPLERKALARRLKRGGYNVIVFRDGKHSYTKIIDAFSDAAASGGISVHLEANQQEMKIVKEKFINGANAGSNLYVSGFSKYELMARRFVADYPITKYVPRSFYNENFTLKSDKQINVVFIGFGKVNYQLFRMCAMQFQFAQEKDGRLASKPVAYHIYDNNAAMLHNEFFSRIQFEFDEEFEGGDFPKPEKICDLDIEQIDINSVEAKKKFKALVTEDSFTCFIISLENDLEDASYAQTVKRLLDDDGNYRIFVRAKNDNGEKLNEINDRIIYFGEEKKLYTHENIINDDLTKLAQRINLLYNDISDAPVWLKELKKQIRDKEITAEQTRIKLAEMLADPVNREIMLQKWAELKPIEKDSNLYHALNLPFKLNMLGFDMVKKKNESDTGITEEQFDERYKNSGRANDYMDYSFYFKTESSNVLAYIEHSRWNALYILYDFKQMKKADFTFKYEKDDDEAETPVKSLVHKNVELKRHACITTYYGLNELVLYKFVTGYPDEVIKNDDRRLRVLGNIYRYDYMDLDRLYSEITAMGYKLIANG